MKPKDVSLILSALQSKIKSNKGLAVFADKDATYTERVLGFVFCAVRNFIIEWAETFCSMAISHGTHVRCRKAENFCERMFCIHLRLSP